MLVEHCLQSNDVTHQLQRERLGIVYGCSHFRPYFEGIRFTIVTDHKALKWLHQTKDLNGRLAGWAMSDRIF